MPEAGGKVQLNAGSRKEDPVTGCASGGGGSWGSVTSAHATTPESIAATPAHPIHRAAPAIGTSLPEFGHLGASNGSGRETADYVKDARNAPHGRLRGGPLHGTARGVPPRHAWPAGVRHRRARGRGPPGRSGRG